MACYHPLKAYRSSIYRTDKGKSKIVFNSKDAGPNPELIELPCGQCIGCRLERSRQWAIRCVHEASLYNNNSFITLTFSTEHLNSSGTLVKADFQKFMKRLRKLHHGCDQFPMGSGKYPIRYFHCGEYGSSFQRPHHHACLFNFDFPDKVLWAVKNGNRLYTSDTLSSLWPFGYSIIGDVTWESAAYVARYITKKVNGSAALEHYSDIDLDTGELLNVRLPEYTTMSRRPGIGRAWFEKHSSDVYPKDFITYNGKKFNPPKYYDSIFDIDNPQEFAKVKKRRKAEQLKHSDNCTPQRLAVREEVQKIKAKQLIRNLENDS